MVSFITIVSLTFCFGTTMSSSVLYMSSIGEYLVYNILAPGEHLNDVKNYYHNTGILFNMGKWV